MDTTDAMPLSCHFCVSVAQGAGVILWKIRKEKNIFQYSDKANMAHRSRYKMVMAHYASTFLPMCIDVNENINSLTNYFHWNLVN